MYDFNEVIKREGTNSAKWDPAIYKRVLEVEYDDAIPMWVADMDFRCPDAMIEAIKNRAEHGIFGYCAPLEDYYKALGYWYQKRHNWTIKPEWVTNTPGVVPALTFIIRALTDENDKVIIQQPVYYPFRDVIVANNRTLVNNALKNTDGNYVMDYEDLEEKVKDPKAKLLILCNPHNPVGRVWDKNELERLGKICNENDVIIVSDEIHHDLILPGNKHTIYATLGEEFSQNSITCTAPSKTFNMAGLQVSNIIIPNSKIKEKVDIELRKSALLFPNIFALVATTAVYSEEGEKWLDELLIYLDKNAEFIKNFVKKNMPNVKYVKPQGTYLAWLDFRDVISNYKQLERIVKEEARVLLDVGSWFGPGGEGFLRINYACPRMILELALLRIANSIYK